MRRNISGITPTTTRPAPFWASPPATGPRATGGLSSPTTAFSPGTNGREYGYLNDDSNLETVIKPAVNGNTVVSTIDLNVQQVVEKYIDEWMTTTGSENIGVVVMDPDTGEILAMATDRMYDLNNPRGPHREVYPGGD